MVDALILRFANGMRTKGWKGEEKLMLSMWSRIMKSYYAGYSRLTGEYCWIMDLQLYADVNINNVF